MLIIQNRFTKPTNKQLISLRKILAAKIPNQKKKKIIPKTSTQPCTLHLVFPFISTRDNKLNENQKKPNFIYRCTDLVAVCDHHSKNENKIENTDKRPTQSRRLFFFFSIDFKMLSDFERATIKIMAFSLHRALYKIKRDLIVALAISDGGDWRLTARIEPIQFFFFWGKLRIGPSIDRVNEILFPFCFFFIFIKIWNVF